MRSNILRTWLRKFVSENPQRWKERQINDDDGNLIAITIEEIPEPPAPTAEELALQALNKAKGDRALAVSEIIVTVDGMAFDGNEEAQNRVARTITAAQALGVDLSTELRTWVLADNTVAQVTVEQLAKALRLAGDAQTALWTVPYEE